MNSRKKNLQAYAFLSPFLVMTAVLYILPAIMTIVMSFTGLGKTFEWKFVGWKNYQNILKDPNTLSILGNTLIYVGVCIVFTILLNLLFAILTTHFIKNERAAGFFKAVLMIPMITPVVVYSVLWLWLLSASDAGMINQLYMAMGGAGSVNWIAKYPLLIVILATLMTSIAYGTIVFSSAIKAIPENQFKAARVDGAKEWEIVKSIVLPNLRFHILFIALWETLGLLTNYVTIMLITGGGPGVQSEVWALSAYHKAFTNQKYGYGAAISMALIAVVLLFMLLIGIVMNRMERRNSIGKE